MASRRRPGLGSLGPGGDPARPARPPLPSGQERQRGRYRQANGANVKIVAPKAPTHGYHNHTVCEAADAAAHMPKSARSVIVPHRFKILKQEYDK